MRKNNEPPVRAEGQGFIQKRRGIRARAHAYSSMYIGLVWLQLWSGLPDEEWCDAEHDLMIDVSFELSLRAARKLQEQLEEAIRDCKEEIREHIAEHPDQADRFETDWEKI
jgi:hypothetical protein